MARLKKADTSRLEYAEGCLGALGNARIYLRLVSERVEVASRNPGQDRLLLPALEDISKAQALIVLAQQQAAQAFTAAEKP